MWLILKTLFLEMSLICIDPSACQAVQRMPRKHLPCLTNIVCKMFDQTRLSNNVKLVVQPLRREYCEISFPNDWHSRQFVKMFYYFSWLSGPSLSNSDMFEASSETHPEYNDPSSGISKLGMKVLLLANSALFSQPLDQFHQAKHRCQIPLKNCSLFLKFLMRQTFIKFGYVEVEKNSDLAEPPNTYGL